jgi:ribonuclease Z
VIAMMAGKRALLAAATVFAAAVWLSAPLGAQPAPFRVVLLGTGTPAPSIERLGPSILVEAGVEKLIFDVGRGVYVRLSQMGIPSRPSPESSSRISTRITSPGCPICG